MNEEPSDVVPTKGSKTFKKICSVMSEYGGGCVFIFPEFRLQNQPSLVLEGPSVSVSYDQDLRGRTSSSPAHRVQ